MKLKKTLFSLAFSLLFSIACLAQFPQSTQARTTNNNFESNLAANNMMRGRDVLQEVIGQGTNNEITLADVEGEPYFKTTFSNGNLMYKDSLNLGEYPMRYNAFSDEMEVNNSDGISVINKADYISVLIDREKYVPLNYQGKDKTIKKGFFIEKANGTKARLFLRKYKTVKQGQEAKTSFHKNTPPKFIEHEAYFLRFGNEPVFEIKMKKGKILKAFPDNVDMLKNYIAQEKLNIETEAGIIALVNYYNGIE